MQKFLDDNLTSRFIKALLYNYNVPLYKTVSHNDYIVENILYVFKHRIIKCTKSGILCEDAEFSEVNEYTFGDSTPRYTTNFISKNNYYDSDTHIALGNFLRLYRDYYGIDLMPFYNCYCNKFVGNFAVSSEGVVKKDRIGDIYKTILIPIKYNTTYTVAIDSPSPVTIAPALMDGNDLLSVLDENISERLWPSGIKYQSSSSFLKPFTYKLSNNDSWLNTFEHNLFMLVQTQYDNDSSIVVLEGDYTDKSKKVVAIDYFKSASDAEKNRILLSDLSLLKMNDTNSYAFSDRLVEYLFGNVISKNNEIKNNISRVQSAVKAKNYYDAVEDVWEDELRKLIFDKFTESNTHCYDINGYVDKDIEKFLLRG